MRRRGRLKALRARRQAAANPCLRMPPSGHGLEVRRLTTFAARTLNDLNDALSSGRCDDAAELMVRFGQLEGRITAHARVARRNGLAPELQEASERFRDAASRIPEVFRRHCR